MLKEKIETLKKTKIAISATNFIAIFSLLTSTVYNISFWKKFSATLNLLNINDLSYLITSYLIIFSFIFSFLSIFCFYRLTKIICSLIMISSSLLIYIVQYYGILVDTHSLISAILANSTEILSFFSLNFFLILFLFGILPTIALTKINITYSYWIDEIKARTSKILLLTTIILCAILTQHSNISLSLDQRQNLKYIIPYNQISILSSLTKELLYKSHKKIYIGTDAQIPKKENILLILIIGESARKDHFSLYGYTRKTNPLLSTNNIIILNNPTSCGTGTYTSVTCMLSHLTQNEYYQNRKNYEFLPSMLQRNGIEVFYKTNSSACYGICHNINNIASSFQDKTEHCHNKICFDQILLTKLDTYIHSRDKNTFIILHQTGSHFPYWNKYPKKFEKFKPTCKKNQTHCSNDEIINTYDNSILYTDFILDKTIKIAKTSNRPAVVIYISDHGESLGENGIYSHGMSYDHAPKEQKEIPFIIWMSESFKELRSLKNNCFNNKKEYSHDNLFHSILGVFKLETSLYNKNMDVFAEKCS